MLGSWNGGFDFVGKAKVERDEILGFVGDE
jgi:hypothetical protein